LRFFTNSSHFSFPRIKPLGAPVPLNGYHSLTLDSHCCETGATTVPTGFRQERVGFLMSFRSKSLSLPIMCRDFSYTLVSENLSILLASTRV
jgi:hypothetical protein